jgi:hypothetical protein
MFMKILSVRTVVLVLLGFFAVRSIDVTGMEEAARRGHTQEVLGIATVPVIFVLIMLAIIFWPRKKGEKHRASDRTI